MNSTKHPFTNSTDSIQLVQDYVSRQAIATPQLAAIQFGSTILSYQELDEYSTRLAVALQEDISVGTIVGFSATRSIDMAIGIVGILKAGKTYLPLDPTFPVARLKTIIQNSGVTNIICSENEVSFFELLNLKSISAYAKETEHNIKTDFEKVAPVYILYTSGSTGIPKGVVMGQTALLNLVEWQNKNSIATIGTKTLQLSPLTFDVSFVEIFSTFSTGGTLVLIADDLRLDPERLLRFMEQESIKRIYLPYVALQYLSDAAEQQGIYPAALREVITAGEALKITQPISRFFSRLPNAILYNQYGPTETHVCTALQLQGDPSHWPKLPSIGQPISDTDIYILNERSELLPHGESGELCIGGICLADGYLNAPELTAEKFVHWQHPQKGLIRIYKTGDIAVESADGNYNFLGRNDDQIKIRGYRVELGEIEVTLSFLAGIQQAVVVADEDAYQQKRLVAYLQASGDKMSLSDIRDELSQLMPDYMIPAIFIWVNEMPKTSSGKIDKKALPKPSQERPLLNSIFREAATVTEQKIAAIWRTLLSWNRIGITDNFFELGGNSLLAIKATAAIKKEFALKLPISTFYRNATIEALAKVIEGDAPLPHFKTPIDKTKDEDHDIAVIGMNGRFPGAETISEFWQLLIEGKEAIQFFADKELDPSIPENISAQKEYIKARGILTAVDMFDAAFFGISPALAALMDPQQRLFLEIAWEVLEANGYTDGCYNGSIGVFAGSGNNTYYLKNVLSNKDKVAASGEFAVMTHNEKDYIATRTAYALNLQGPAVSVYAACATSLLAVAQAVQSIRDGHCDVAIAGGVSITVPIKSGHIYQQSAMLSMDGHTRPFDAAATGTVFSDGAGVVLLKSKQKAIEDGDFIYGFIKGIGINNDGYGKGSFTAPSATGQAGAIYQAIQDAGIQPIDISYVEAHGTATPLGDPIELEGLQLAFGRDLPKQYCAIGSVKSNIGHLTAAAGVAGLIKTLLMFQHKQLVPSLFYKTPNPEIDINNSSFYVNTSIQELSRDVEVKGGISSFGVGGTNVHIIVSSFNNPEKISTSTTEPVLICWSAKTIESIGLYANKLINYLEKNPTVNLADLAYTLQFARTHFAHRQFLIANSYDNLVTQLKEFCKGVVIPGHQHPLAKNGMDWVAGKEVNFKELYPQAIRKKLIDVPTYAFSKKSYWLDAQLANAVTTRSPHIITSTAIIEDQLRAIIMNVSGEDESILTNQANFISIGLDSLVLTQLAIQITKAFDVPISFRLLNEELDHITALANFIRKHAVVNELVEAAPVGLTKNILTEEEQKEIAKPFGAIAKIEKNSIALSTKQKFFINEFAKRYNTKTVLSKSSTAANRSFMADPRVVSGFKPLLKETIYPIVVNKSDGSRLWDIDGNEYIDTLNGFGSNLLGYQHPILKAAVLQQVEAGYEVGPQHMAAGEVCKLICSLSNMERSALCNTGSEAVLGAIRIARTVTGRSLIVAFTGSYHGINDEVIVRGSKKYQSFPAAPGILPESVANILVLDYGTPETLQIIEQRAHELAAVLVEPVQSRRPEFQPIQFLKKLRAITSTSGTALIFDEVITGFRSHPGGAQFLFDVKADLATYGKVIGGGMPIGAIAGSRKWMDALDGGDWQFGDDSVPEIGVTYFAGTFVRHPLALAAAKASLLLLKEQGVALIESINELTSSLVTGLNAIAEKYELPFYVVHFASIWKIKMRDELPYAELLFTIMREKGIHIWDGFPCFLTAAYTTSDIKIIIKAFEDAVLEMLAGGFFAKAPINKTPYQEAKIVASFPMIAPQEEIWMSCQIGGDDANRSYNESVSLKFNGHCNKIALEKSLYQLVERHEALRTVCSEEGPILLVFDQLPFTYLFQDLSGFEAVAQDEYIQRYLQENAITVFNLQNGSLFRVAFFKLGANSAYLCLTVHHLVADGWSIGNLLVELSKLYSANYTGEKSKLHPPLLFRDFAKAHANFQLTAAYHQSENYWVKKLAELGEPFSIPTDFDRPASRTYKSQRTDYALPRELIKQLSELGASAGCSLVTTLVACFEVLLYKLTYAEQVVIGLPAAGQPVTGFDALVGHCVNLLPIVSKPKSKIAFIDYLKERKKAILNDYEHQQISFGTLMKKLPAHRQLSSVPLIPIVLNIDIDLDKGAEFEGLDYQLIYNPRDFETFEIFVNISGTNSHFVMEWSYNTNLFKASTIAQMMQRFERLISAVIATPTALIGNLTTVDEAKVLQALAHFNNTSAAYPEEKPVHVLFEEKALQQPNAIAVRFGITNYTYKQLNERANQIANSLHKAGLPPNAIVAVCVNRSIDMVAAVIGVYKSGAAFLAVDADHPPQRIASFISKANAAYIITEPHLNSILPAEVNKIYLSDTEKAGIQNLSITISNTATSFVLFTSGSTGEPKGVLLTHKGLTNVILGLQKIVGFTEKDKLLFVTTIIFDLAQADIFLPLVSGGELVLTSKNEAKDGYQLLKLIQDHGITYIEAPPVTYKIMLAAGWDDRLNLQLTSCGEELSVDLATALLKRCNRLFNMYGPTECTIYTTAAIIENPAEGITIGHPFSNMQVYILDEDGELLPQGVIGELYIAGDGVAKGYLNDAALTKQKFVPCKFSADPTTIMFKTGDLAKFRPDGSIEFFGRKDNQAKIRGLRIEMGEIEFHLRKLTGIKDAVVTVRTDIVKDNKTIVAYLVGEDEIGSTPTNAEIRAWRAALEQQLPIYFVPNIFVKLSELPITGTGKINRKALPKPIISNRSNKVFVPATTLIQKKLQSIWSDALALPTLSMQDDFFELGGHSLIAIQVMTRLKKETGHQIPISALFQYSTIEKLSRLLDDQQNTNWNCLVPIKPAGTQPPLYVIHGDGLNVLVFRAFSVYIDEDQPVWGIQSKGLDGHSIPKETISEIAAEYLAEILALNPDGPYNFAGYSFGGLVAYELAKQLTSKGKKVNFVGVLDTNISNETFYQDGHVGISGKLKRQLPKLKFITQSFFANPKQTVAYQRFIIKNKMKELWSKIGLTKNIVEEEKISHEEKILNKLTHAYQTYDMQAAPIEVDLFRCKKRPYFVDDPIYLGWKKYALKGVNIIEVEGDHQTFLYPPNNRSFAASIQQVLKQRNK